MFARSHNFYPREREASVSACDDPSRDGCSYSCGSHTCPLFTERHLCEKAHQQVLCIDREWLTGTGLHHSGSRELRGDGQISKKLYSGDVYRFQQFPTGPVQKLSFSLIILIQTGYRQRGHKSCEDYDLEPRERSVSGLPGAPFHFCV